MFGQFSDIPLLRTIFGQRSAKFLGLRTDPDRISSETGTTSVYVAVYATAGPIWVGAVCRPSREADRE